MIRQIVEQLVFNSLGVTMEHGDQYFNNLIADEAASEVVFLIDPVKFNIAPQDLTYLRERYPVVMLFLGKTQLADGPTDLATVVEQQRQRVRAFLAACRDSHQLVSSVTDISSVEVNHLYDADYSGWMLYVTLTPANSGSTC